MPSTDQAERTTSEHRGSRRIRPAALTAVVLIVALVGVGAFLWMRQKEQERQAGLLSDWTTSLETWDSATLGLLPNPPIQLASLVNGAGTEGAEAFDALQAQCTAANNAATAVAAGEAPPQAPGGLNEDLDGVANATSHAEAGQEALSTYQAAVAANAAEVAQFCSTYPALLTIQTDQSAALASLAPLLGECAIDDLGCLPEDPETWGAIADVMVTAYADPARARAEVYGASCPIPVLAPVCGQQATENALLASSYDAYIEAVRGGDADAVTTARDALASQLEVSNNAIATATVTALGDTGTDAPTAIASAISAWAVASDAAWLTADEGLLASLG